MRLSLRSVQRLFADAGLCADVRERVRLTGGTNSQVIQVRCEGEASTFILKVYAPEYRWKMAKEAFIYGLLEREPPLPTPRVLVADDTGRLIPDAYIIMTEQPGEPAASVLEGLPERDVAAIYADVGSILRSFHEVTLDAFGYLSTTIVDPRPSNRAYMEHQFAKKIREFAELGGDSAITRIVERAAETSSHLLDRCSRAALCHDDLHEWNVLVLQRDGEWHVGGVLDVENAVAGDPLLDLAKTDYYAIRGDLVKRRALLQGYGPRPGRAEETMALYRLYHALELWDWFALNGNSEPLAGIAEEIRATAASI